MNPLLSTIDTWNKAWTAQVLAASYFTEGLQSYGDEFVRPLIAASQLFAQVESERLLWRTPQETCESYLKLLNLNLDLMTRYTQGTLATLDQFNRQKLDDFFTACLAPLFDPGSEKLEEFLSEQKDVLKRVVEQYPKAIKAIEPEYGFHFERHPDSLVAETDRFILRKVHPTDDGIKTDDGMKPVLIIPPFVLGANILSFLPAEGKSYAHAFANRSIPTYIRIMKDIQETPAVQTMSLEDDALDTKHFCEILSDLHQKPVTINGYCQGGLSAVCNILSGALDGLVDALITCVAPMDGTRSEGLGKFLNDLPQDFNDLAYGTKELNNGNRVADGQLMGWIYKLKSIEDSGPVTAFFRDIMMLSTKGDKPVKINKTVAAINYWLQNERSDLPMAVTKMSFASYSTPVGSDGRLPIEMFGKPLNFKGIEEKNIAWLLCYGERDDLVEREVALAPLDYIDVEVTPFPKGHVAIATSWSHPDSDCALDTVFGDNYRGPVRFQLDLDASNKK